MFVPQSDVVERLHIVVDRDRNRTRHSRNIAADHQDHSKLTQRVRERQNHSRKQAADRQGQHDAKKCPQPREPSTEEAASSLGSTEAKAAETGCTMKGKL